MAVALFNILSMTGESPWSKAIYMAVHPKKYWKKPLLSQENRSPQMDHVGLLLLWIDMDVSVIQHPVPKKKKLDHVGLLFLWGLYLSSNTHNVLRVSLVHSCGL